MNRRELPGSAANAFLPAIIAFFCLTSLATAEEGVGMTFSGRVVMRGRNTPVPGVLIALAEAQKDGKPKDELLATVKADEHGKFTLFSAQVSDGPVALVVFAVREMAQTGGNHRHGFDVKHVRIMLGYLPGPVAARPNTIIIDRRKLGQGADKDN